MSENHSKTSSLFDVCHASMSNTSCVSQNETKPDQYSKAIKFQQKYWVMPKLFIFRYFSAIKQFKISSFSKLLRDEIYLQTLDAWFGILKSEMFLRKIIKKIALGLQCKANVFYDRPKNFPSRNINLAFVSLFKNHFSS